MSPNTRMSRLFVGLACTGAVAAALLTSCALGSSGTPAPDHGGETLMLLPENAAGPVGVVRRTDLLVAYGKSKYLKEHYKTLETARDAARDAGDEELTAKIEAEGPYWQEVMHRQLAGEEPLYTILLAVQDELRDVADAHNLSKVLEAGKGVEGIDITDELAEKLAQSQDKGAD
ncbi:MAG: hypothetical protein KDA31_08220 [Phycisphaerales bacterium]|nr:hypothetical protein [Phycisphaerales bacterium]MCB9835895.1 hypothetical protein [Phycisphaera sp.]